MGEWKYSSTILDLCPRWRWVVSVTTRPLYPRERAHPPGAYLIGWAGPGAGLDALEWRKILPLLGIRQS
jgi:hypothetical protein